MVFVAAGCGRAQMDRLSHLLVSAFPGSTIYQHTNLFRAPHDVLSHKVNAVFLEVETGKTNSLDFIPMLHRQKPDVPVFVFSNTEELRDEAARAGADDYFVQPIDEQRLWDAMRLVKERQANGAL